jgi:hypothetical protein
MSPEEVIYEVLTWKGTFEAVAAEKLPPPGIEAPVSYLVMEGMRLAEERQVMDDKHAGEAREMAARTIQDLDAGETPDGVRRLVARRYLARGQTAPVETLVKLAQDPDLEVSAEAIRSIYDLPVVVLKTVAGDAATPDVVLRHLVEEFWHDDHIMRCVAENSAASDHTMGVLASLASESVLSLITKDAARVARSAAIQAGMNNRGHRALRLRQKQQTERKQKSGGSIHKRILDLPIPDKIFLAYRGSPAERAILAQNPKRTVAEAVLKSPKITDGEIESIASMKSVHVDVLTGIASNPLWINHYPIAKAVVTNPKTPTYVSIDLLKRMREVDLKLIEKDRNLPEALRASSGRRLQVLAKKRGL